MQDIGVALTTIMQAKQCSPICAFFLLSEKQKEGDINGIHKLQPEPEKKVSRRLCNKSNFQNHEQAMG